MEDPTPPAWVDEWMAPRSDGDWGFEKRHDAWLLAYLMTSHPGIVRSKNGAGGLRSVMDSIVRLSTPTKLKRALSRYPRPVEKVPAPPRLSVKKDIFNPPPRYSVAGAAAACTWGAEALTLYPVMVGPKDEDYAEKLRKQMDLIAAKTALGIEPKAPWSSYWVAMRLFVKTAFDELESYALSEEDRYMIGLLADVFLRVRAARELGYQLATINAGAHSGAAPDQDLLSDGDAGRRDSSEAGGPAVPADDDGVPEDLEADELGPDRDLPGADEEGDD